MLTRLGTSPDWKILCAFCETQETIEGYSTREAAEASAIQSGWSRFGDSHRCRECTDDRIIDLVKSTY